MKAHGDILRTKRRAEAGGPPTGRKFPARPVRTPGWAHGLFEAPRGRPPCSPPAALHALSCRAAACLLTASRPPHRPPSKQRGGRASGGHAWPPNIKCGWCWPGAGVPGQRRRAPGGGGAKPRAALLPRCKHGPRGGGTRRAHRLSVLDSPRHSRRKKGPRGP